MEKIQISESINSITKFVKKELANEKYKSIPKPYVIAITVGDDPIAKFCIEKKQKAFESVGIKFKIYDYKSAVDTDHLKNIISKLSLDPLVTGIIVQGPLPEHIKTFKLIDEIDPVKDIEGVTLVQNGAVFSGRNINNKLVSPDLLALLDIIWHNIDIAFPTIVTISTKSYSNKIGAYLSNTGNVIDCTHPEKIVDFINNSDIIVITSQDRERYNSRYFYGKPNKIIIDNSLINRDGKLYKSIDIESIEREVTISNTFKYITMEDGLADLVAIYDAFNVVHAYDSQFDFIWKYCKNRNLKD